MDWPHTASQSALRRSSDLAVSYAYCVHRPHMQDHRRTTVHIIECDRHAPPVVLSGGTVLYKSESKQNYIDYPPTNLANNWWMWMSMWHYTDRCADRTPLEWHYLSILTTTVSKVVEEVDQVKRHYLSYNMLSNVDLSSCLSICIYQSSVGHHNDHRYGSSIPSPTANDVYS